MLFCSFLCEQLDTKTTDRIFMKILSEMYHRTRKSPLNSGSLPDLDPDLGILKEFFTIVRY